MTKHSGNQPTGITDKAADVVHEFLEATEEEEHKAHPGVQLDRGTHDETTDTGVRKGLGGADKGGSPERSTMESIKETLNLKSSGK